MLDHWIMPYILDSILRIGSSKTTVGPTFFYYAAQVRRFSVNKSRLEGHLQFNQKIPHHLHPGAVLPILHWLELGCMPDRTAACGPGSMPGSTTACRLDCMPDSTRAYGPRCMPGSMSVYGPDCMPDRTPACGPGCVPGTSTPCLAPRLTTGLPTRVCTPVCFMAGCTPGCFHGHLPLYD